MKPHSIVLACLLLFIVFFSVDYYLYGEYQPYIAGPLALHDITSNIYAVSLEANNLHPQVYDPDNLWGEGSFLLHSKFVKMFGYAYKGIKTCLSFFNGLYAILFFLALLHLSKCFKTSLLFTSILIGCLSANNFISGPGYASYYSFFMNFASLLLFLIYLKNRNNVHILFIMGAILGISYGFKFEMGSIGLFTFALIILFDNLFFEHVADTHLKRRTIVLLYATILIFFTSILLMCIKYGFFSLTVLPILVTLYSLLLFKKNHFRVNKKMFTSLFWFFSGFLLLVFVWIFRLAHVSSLSYAVSFYFPFFRLEYISSHISTHFVPFGFKNMIDRALWGHQISYRDTFLVASFMLTLLLFLKKWRDLSIFKMIVIVSSLSFLTSILVHHPFYMHRPFFEIYLLVFFTCFLIFSKRIEFTPQLQCILLLLCGQLLVFMREPSCLAYESWNILPTAILLTIYLINSNKFFSFTFNNICIITFLVLLIHSSATISNKYIFNALDIHKDNYSYSKTLNLKIPTNIAKEFDRMEDFFHNNLKRNENIFVFSTIKLPYTTAKRFLPKMLPTFDALRTPQRSQTLLNHLRVNKSNIKYVILFDENSVRFAGEDIKKNYPDVFSFIKTNYSKKTTFWKFIVLERHSTAIQ